MISPLAKFRSRLSSHERAALDSSRILMSAIRGFAQTITVPASASPVRRTQTGLPSTLTLISRLSCRRAGTRFNARGLDDLGNVANFVETETVFWSPGICFSYSQVRGSVPVFWEQTPGMIPGQQKIQITRSPEATQPAFDKHFEMLEIRYGVVHILNLLSESKPGEAELTNRYRYHVRQSPLNRDTVKGVSTDHQLLKETEFDFHAETKGPGGYEAASVVRDLIEPSAEGFAYYLSEDIDDSVNSLASGAGHNARKSVVILQQEGIFRTNCLDCLDRTNLVQTIISQMALESFLAHRGERASGDFWMRHSSLWADSGDVRFSQDGECKKWLTSACTVSFQDICGHGGTQIILYQARKDVTGGGYCRRAKERNTDVHQQFRRQRETEHHRYSTGRPSYSQRRIRSE